MVKDIGRPPRGGVDRNSFDRPFQNYYGTYFVRGWMVVSDVIMGRRSKPCRRSHVDADLPPVAVSNSFSPGNNPFDFGAAASIAVYAQGCRIEQPAAGRPGQSPGFGWWKRCNRAASRRPLPCRTEPLLPKPRRRS